MEPILAIAAAIVFAFSLYALLRRNFLRIVIGFMLISNAVNLMIFAAGRLTRGHPPIVPKDQHFLEISANPIPQALILTAIVISFGLTAFAFSLAYRVQKSLQTLDTEILTEMEDDAAPTPKTHEGEGGHHLAA